QKQHQLAGGLVGETSAAVFFHPREREIDACRNAGRRVDVPVPDPERVVLDPHLRVLRRQLAAELPVGGRTAAIQQPGLREQEHTYTYGPEPPDLSRRLLQPGGQRRVTHRAAAQSTDQEYGVADAFDLVEVMPGHERQHTALAL